MDEFDNIVGYVGGSEGGLGRDFHYEDTFDVGSYLIVAEMEWGDSISNRDFVVSAYG